MLTTSVNNFRSIFEEFSQYVEDIIDTESRIVTYNLPKPKRQQPKPTSVISLDTSNLLLSSDNIISEKLRITMEERMPPSRFASKSILPDQIPKIKSINKQQKRKRKSATSKRVKKSIDPLKEFLDDELYKSPSPLPISIPRNNKLTTQAPPSPILKSEDQLPLTNPFLSDECCSLDDGDLEEIPPVPLTMYSFFQFPLQEDLDSFTSPSSDDCTVSDYSELDSLYSSSSSSSESDSILSPSPSSNLCHLAAYTSTNTDFTLSPRFKLRLSRDKLVASIDQRERAYLITYANQLLESRSQISMIESSNFSEEESSSYSSSRLAPINSSSLLFFDESEDLSYTGSYIRDLNGICTPLTKSELELKEERKLVLNHLDNFIKGRDIRGNSLSWLMLSLEFRMINNNKIVRPLKPRAYLPKRLQEFKRNLSPLRKEIKY